MFLDPLNLMRKNEILKKQHERAVGGGFIKLHNGEGGNNFAFVKQPKKDPPDLIYEDKGASKILLLEITAAYYNQKHAKWEWDIWREIDTSKISVSPCIMQPALSSYAFLNDLIQKKCKNVLGAKKKRPNDFADPIFLVIDIKMFSTTTTDIQDFITSDLVFPAKIPFQEIWLLLSEPYTGSSTSQPKQERQSSEGKSLRDVFPLRERRFRLYPKVEA